VGNEAKDNPSEDFLTVNGTGIGHEAQNPASYMTMKLPHSCNAPIHKV